MNTRCRQCGLSLVELMIGMLLGLILMAGVIEIFVSSSASYELNQGLAQVQEKGRFATAFLTHDIRMAGYTGCSGGSPSNIVSTLDVSSTDYLYNFKNGFQGFDAQGTSWSPALSSTLTALTNPPVENSDVIAVRTVQGIGMHISEGMPKSSAELKVSNAAGTGLEEGDIVMLTDCSAAAVFQVTAVQTSANHIQHNTGTEKPGNSTKDLGQAFRIGSEVQKIATVTYFIAARDGSKSCASGTCGLWEKIGSGAEQELVSGITNMQVLYGVDTGTDLTPNRYVTADNVTDWNSVVSVKIAVLAESDAVATPIPTTAPTYDLLDHNVTNGNAIPAPKDGHLRKVFSDTIAVRNRVL